nr:GtrA family protein [Convivina intestini]
MDTVKNLYQKHRETILYLFFGGATFVANMICYYVLADLLNLDVTISYLISWFVAVLFAYLTNRIWVFQSQVKHWQGIAQEVWQFYLARILTGILGWLILVFGVELLHQNGLLWNGIQNIFVIVSNYALSKLYIFKDK